MDVIHDNDDKAKPTTNNEEQRQRAAIVVQRAWRRHAQRKDNLSTDARWKDTLQNMEKERVIKEAGQDKNDPRSRFRRGVFLAARLADGNALPFFEEDHRWRHHNEPKLTKELESQHMLEFVDPKHRYGSNLKYYHQKWIAADTDVNFFKWLDEGDGKDLSLPECSREQLESERILFLSAEQRLNYLIKVDPEGKIRWERNNEYVDTAPGKWIDAGDGQGIVRSEGEGNEQNKQVDDKNHRGKGHDPKVAETARHYEGVTGDRSLNSFQRMWKDRFTTNGLMERLLRKTVRKNTWLYVSDKNFNVFVGIKETGYFQHSSFTSGGQVTSAGLIEVDNGLVTNLSPLSGHYRTGIDHFKQFLEIMNERGMDLHRIHVTKGEVLLWSLEHWKGFTKSLKQSKKKVHHAAHVAVHPRKAKEEEEEERKKEEENKQAMKQVDAAEAAAIEAEEKNRKEATESTIRRKLAHHEEKKENQPESSSSGKWDGLTGRARKEGEDQWKTAMERREEQDDTKEGAQTAKRDGAEANATREGETNVPAPNHL